MAIPIASGSSSAGVANVNANFELEVHTPTTEDTAGFVQLSSEVDSGLVTGSRTVRALEVSRDYRLRVGTDHPMYNLSFEGTIIATDRIQQSVSTITIAQANGFLVVNSAGVFGSGNHGNWKTYRTFPVLGSYPLYVELWQKETNHDAGVAVSEWGVGYAATTAVPTDGVFFRRLAGGQLQGVINFAGVETPINLTTTAIPSRDGSGTYDATEVSHYLIVIHNDSVKFWINDILVGSIDTPSNQGNPSRTSALPVFNRVYYSSAGAAARTLDCGFINVSLGDANSSKPWSHIMAGMGGGSYQTQPGVASGPTVTRGTGALGWPTSATVRIAGTWTATSAPALNSLGGLWTTPAISTLTTDVDYPVFSYLNPVGTATLPGKTLYVTGIRVGEAYATAAAAAQTILLTHIVAVGSTSPTTNVVDAATTVAARATVTGAHAFLSTAIVGTMVAGYTFHFDSPLVVPTGCYFQFIVRPFGTVTANTLVVTSSLAVNGYFE